MRNARVSIAGHSLGSVIAYDVLTGFGRDGGLSLEFEVDNFFLWGSPLAAFVSIADKEQQSGKFVLPGRTNTYNMFHPHDPVAFRLEPLYYHNEDQIAPEMIQHWVNNGINSSKQWIRSYEYAKVLAHRKWTSLKSSVWQALNSSSQTDVWRVEWDDYLNSEPDSADILGRHQHAEGTENMGDHFEGKLLGPKVRIDFALQEHLVEGYVESYALLQSHFCYWNSHDVALFMLKKMCKEGISTMSSFQRDQKEATERAAAARAAEHDTAQSTESASLPRSMDPLSMLPALPDKDEILRRLGDMSCVRQKNSQQRWHQQQQQQQQQQHEGFPGYDVRCGSTSICDYKQ